MRNHIFYLSQITTKTCGTRWSDKMWPILKSYALFTLCFSHFNSKMWCWQHHGVEMLFFDKNNLKNTHEETPFTDQVTSRVRWLQWIYLKLSEREKAWKGLDTMKFVIAKWQNVNKFKGFKYFCWAGTVLFWQHCCFMIYLTAKWSSLLNIWCKCIRESHNNSADLNLSRWSTHWFNLQIYEWQLPSPPSTAHSSVCHAHKSNIQITLRAFPPPCNLFSGGFNYLTWII